MGVWCVFMFVVCGWWCVVFVVCCGWSVCECGVYRV
jgi:hypothetical protein